MRKYQTLAHRVLVASAAAVIPAALLIPSAASAATGPPFAAGTLLAADESSAQVLAAPAGGGAWTTIVDGGTLQGLPQGVAVDNEGNVFVSSYAPKGTYNQQLTEVPADGSAAKVLDTDLSRPQGVAVDAAGDVFVADADADSVIEVPADGGAPTAVATGLGGPYDVAVDTVGDLYVADVGGGDVSEIPAGGGTPTTIATGLNTPLGVAVDTAGNVYITEQGNGTVVEVPAGGGTPTTLAAGLDGPTGIALDAAGNVYVSELAGSQVVEIPANGSGATTVRTDVAAEALAIYAPPPTFTADTPGTTATVGTAYSYDYTADVATGQPAARFRLASGSLPPGLALDSATGALTGKPTTAGTYTFQVQTENAATASIGPSTTISVVAADSTPPVSTLDAQHGTVDRHQSLLTMRATAVVKNRANVTLGTVGPVTCWNSQGVTATMTATDSGSGVASLTYSATGAQPVASTTVTDLPATVEITKAGRTRIGYHATDKAGNVEKGNSETVIDGNLLGEPIACALPTPTRFALPAHGTMTLTGTVTVGGWTYPFRTSIRF